MAEPIHVCMTGLVGSDGSYANKTSSIRMYDMNPIHSVKLPDGEERSICTFKIETTYTYLNDICGMIGAISFENPDRKQIRVFANGHLHSGTTDNFVSFSDSSSAMTSDGKLMQEVAVGYQNTSTQTHFPEFCGGKVHSKYLNMSRVDRLQIDGLTDDSVIIVDCYTIMKHKYCFVGPEWVSYVISF